MCYNSFFLYFLILNDANSLINFELKFLAKISRHQHSELKIAEKEKLSVNYTLFF